MRVRLGGAARRGLIHEGVGSHRISIVSENPSTAGVTADTHIRVHICICADYGPAGAAGGRRAPKGPVLVVHARRTYSHPKAGQRELV